MPLRLWPALSALCLAACAAPCPTQTPLVQSGAWVQGTVVAPAAWADAAGPVANADVALADGDGMAIAGLFQPRTSPTGGFAIQGVPAGFGYVVSARLVRADGSEVVLQALAAPTDHATLTPLTVGSTLATQLATDGRSGPVGPVDTAAFAALAAALQQRFDAAPSAPGAALTAAKGWVQQDATLAASVSKVHDEAAPRTGDASARATAIAASSDRTPLDGLSQAF